MALKKPTKREVETALLMQIDPSGGESEQKHFIDLARDYMTLWDTKQLIAKDIKKRGVVIDYTSNNGIVNKKKNESVDQLVKVNAQMLRILDELGIKLEIKEEDEDL